MTTGNTGKEKLDPTKAPSLPLMPVVYDRQQQDIVNNILRQYFITLDNINNALVEVNGARFLSAPYAAFQNNANITAAAANTAYPVPFGKFDYGSGVSIVTNGTTLTRITVTYAGIYNFQFSAQLSNSSSSNIGEVSLWLRKNGTNVPESNTFITVPTSHGDINGFAVAAWNLPISLQAGDYFELMWSTTHTTISIAYLPAQTSPTRPETPAVIGTLGYFSRL